MSHGQSEYTPTKQKHLIGLLTTNRYAWNPTVNRKPEWANREIIAIDCTSGTGHTADGESGSPVLINQWARESYGEGFRQLCCEANPQSYVKLRQNDLPNADIQLGKYQDIAPAWLESLGVRKPALGFIYVDPNGAKDLIEGIDFFRWLITHPYFSRLDLIFHWSMNAYSRNAGNGTPWAQTPLLNVVQELARLKRYTFMREPLEKWQWVFMQVLSTDKVSPVWKSERIMSYRQWMDEYAHRFTSDRPDMGQMSFFDQPNQGMPLTVPTQST